MNVETKFGECFDLPIPNLRSYFNRVVSGQPDVYQTPFYGRKPVTAILDGWMPTLRTIQKKWPSLFAFEEDLAKKVGPMSVMAPLSERMADIDSYYDSVHKESRPIPQAAIDATVREFGAVSGLRMRSQEKTNEVMKKSTSSGSPYFQKRKDVVSKTVPCNILNDRQFLPGGDWKYCAILGWRGQEGGPRVEDVKQRVVWMFPYAVNLQELRVYQPLIEACQRTELVPAWVDMECVDKRITQLFDTKGAEDLVVCTDFSKFDQHFNKDMSDAALTILSKLFTNSAEFKTWSSEVFPIKYSIPLAYDWGKLKFGLHGMGSGSGGTNADETLTHRALQHEAALAAGTTLNLNSQCLGDDGILSYPGITVEDVTSIYSAHGQDMNISKQYASTVDCVYLRRWHSMLYRINGICVGVYSTCRALGRLAMQERYYDPEVWGPIMVALRQLSIIENVKYHPLREEFVNYCMKGDKYRLGIDIPGFLNNIQKHAREAIEYMPDFLGYTKSMQKRAASGIEDWWVVNYLKSVA